MADAFGEWEIVERKTNKPISHLIGMMLQMFLVSEPVTYSSVTWILRHPGSGETRKVTAKSEAEAAQRVAAGDFDPAPSR